ITREASFRALEAFISPSASSIPLITLALASRLASASAAMARCMASSRASCRVTSNIKHSSHSYSLINNKSNTTVRKPVASPCLSILLVAKKKCSLNGGWE
uniref:Uncharacterized protein n=1 Tax=Neolamprologus brichardi TaxID=32507 RepID=A0A3Q4G1E7_NEOBR